MQTPNCIHIHAVYSQIQYSLWMCMHGFRKGKHDLTMDKTVNFEIRVLVYVHGETIS